MSTVVVGIELVASQNNSVMPRTIPAAIWRMSLIESLSSFDSESFVCVDDRRIERRHPCAALVTTRSQRGLL
jgi:hypothetical protein